eukprot:jgi/Mesvir1/22229/Mv13041-RA.1
MYSWHPSQWTVRELKDAVRDHFNIASSQQRLIYQGQFLGDECTLASYGLAEGHTLLLTSRAPTTAPPPPPPPSGSSSSASQGTATEDDDDDDVLRIRLISSDEEGEDEVGRPHARRRLDFASNRGRPPQVQRANGFLRGMGGRGIALVPVPLGPLPRAAGGPSDPFPLGSALRAPGPAADRDRDGALPSLSVLAGPGLPLGVAPVPGGAFLENRAHAGSAALGGGSSSSSSGGNLGLGDHGAHEMDVARASNMLLGASAPLLDGGNMDLLLGITLGFLLGIIMLLWMMERGMTMRMKLGVLVGAGCNIMFALLRIVVSS